MEQIRGESGRFLRQHKRWSLDNFDDGFVDAKGRFRVCFPEHPRAAKNGYVLRAIVAYEAYHGIMVSRNMRIHHEDGNTLDDTPENLVLLSDSEHQKRHAYMNGLIIKKTCLHCGKSFEINKWRLRNPSRGKFCSLLCFHRYGVSHQTRQKRSRSVTTSWNNPLTRENRIKGMKRASGACVDCGTIPISYARRNPPLCMSCYQKRWRKKGRS